MTFHSGNMPIPEQLSLLDIMKNCLMDIHRSSNFFVCDPGLPWCPIRFSQCIHFRYYGSLISCPPPSDSSICYNASYNHIVYAGIILLSLGCILVIPNISLISWVSFPSTLIFIPKYLYSLLITLYSLPEKTSWGSTGWLKRSAGHNTFLIRWTAYIVSQLCLTSKLLRWYVIYWSNYYI